MRTLTYKLIFCFMGGALFTLTAQANLSAHGVQMKTKAYSPWSVSLFSLVSTEVQEQLDGGARLFAYNALSLNYRTGGGKLSLGVPVVYLSAGYDSYTRRNEPAEISLNDIFVRYTVYDLILLPGDISTYWEGRFYLPTSKNSHEQGLQTRYRNTFILSRLLSRNLILEYVNKLSYYFQSQSTYLKESTKANGEVGVSVRNTKQLNIDQWMSLWYTINPNHAAGAYVGADNTIYNESVIQPARNKKLVKVGLQYRVKGTDRLSFLIQYSNNVKWSDAKDRLGRFAAEDSSVSVFTFFRF